MSFVTMKLNEHTLVCCYKLGALLGKVHVRNSGFTVVLPPGIFYMLKIGLLHTHLLIIINTLQLPGTPMYPCVSVVPSCYIWPKPLFGPIPSMTYSPTGYS